MQEELFGQVRVTQDKLLNTMVFNNYRPSLETLLTQEDTNVYIIIL